MSEYHLFYNRPENSRLKAYLFDAAWSMHIDVDAGALVVRTNSKHITFAVLVDEECGGDVRSKWAEGGDPTYRSMVAHLVQHEESGVWLGKGPDALLLVYDKEAGAAWGQELGWFS